MRQKRLFARQRSKYRVATTDSRHGGPIAPNRLKDLRVERPNQVWVTDATCVLTAQGWLYLDAPLAIDALSMALKLRRPTTPVIVHSDRGSQFASAAYRQVLSQNRLIASMSRKGNCYDNAYIESFWSTLKYELVYHYRRFTSLANARTAIFDYIETFYNRIRLHSSLAFMSPIAFESHLT
ncbi:MAG: IS3 family transposase [Acidobacteriota bacterium]